MSAKSARKTVADTDAQHVYTPALGFRALTPIYDAAIAFLTRETVWRSTLIKAIGLKGGERLLDVGCGTGSLTVRLARETAGAEVTGIDPDPDVLRRAKGKAARASVRATFHEGFLSAAFFDGREKYDVITSSLVFHQVPLDGKAEILSMIRRGLKPGGRVLIADYGRQRSALMRALFRATVQALDGVEDTQPNADGVLLSLMEQAGFMHIEEVRVIPTPTGSISIFKAR